MPSQHSGGLLDTTAQLTAEATPAGNALWTTRGPSTWPDLPSPMSYTVLRDIEICPLRWALRRGSYPDVWSGKGYPSAPPFATVAGQIIHGALERIVREVGGPSDRDPTEVVQTPMGALSSSPNSLDRIIAALRTLGGITAVLEAVLNQVVHTWTENPRLAPRAREWESELRRQLPMFRQRVQQLLAQVDVGRAGIARRASEPVTTATERLELRFSASGARSQALSPGVYAEVPLNNPELDWYGKADLLSVGHIDPNAHAADGCEIVDFKTGVAKDDHSLQLRIYSLLWAREQRLNPTGRIATRLTLVYPSGPVSVAPPANNAELDALAAEVHERTKTARAIVVDRPPEPRLSKLACEWCDVRQMCDAYWAAATRAAVMDLSILDMIEDTARTGGPEKFADVELSILEAQGRWSWLARITASGALTTHFALGDRVLVRARVHDTHFVQLLARSRRVRIIAAQCFAPSEESGGLSVIALTRSTEAFLLPLPAEETPRDVA